MEERLERLVEMMEELKALENQEMKENTEKIEANNTEKSHIEKENERLEVMRAPFEEGEKDYDDLTVEIEANKVELNRIEKENESLKNRNTHINIGNTHGKEKKAITILKDEILAELTNKQRDLVTKRRDGEQEIQRLETRKADFEAEIARMNQEMQDKGMEINEEQVKDSKNIAELEEKNKEVLNKLNLAKSYINEKATIEEEQKRLQKEIEDAKKGIEIEKKAVALGGHRYTGKLEVQQKWLSQKEEKFANNTKRLEEMRTTLGIRSLDYIEKFVELSEKRYEKNSIEIENLSQKPNDRIKVLQDEITGINAKIMKAEKGVEDILAKIATIKENIPAYNEARYGGIEELAGIIDKIRKIELNIKPDTDINETIKIVNEAKEPIRTIGILENELETLKENDKNLSQKEIDELVAKTKEEVKLEEISNAKAMAKETIDKYFESKDVTIEQVPNINWLLKEAINREERIEGLRRLENIEYVEDVIKRIIELNEEKIEDIKSKTGMTEEDRQKIAELTEKLDEVKEECDILGIEYKEHEGEEHEGEGHEGEGHEGEGHEGEGHEGEGHEGEGHEGEGHEGEGHEGEGHEGEGHEGEGHEGEGHEGEGHEGEGHNNEKLTQVEDILIGKNIKIVVYDPTIRSKITRTISAKQVSKNLKLNNYEKIALINKVTGKSITDEIRNKLEYVDSNVVYALAYCLNKNLISTQEANKRLDTYISAIWDKHEDRNESAIEETKEILRYEEYNKMFKGETYRKFKANIEDAKDMEIAKIESKSKAPNKKEKQGFLSRVSRIFGKKPVALAESNFFEEDLEEIDKRGTKRVGEESAADIRRRIEAGFDVKRKTEEVSAKHREEEKSREERSAERDETIEDEWDMEDDEWDMFGDYDTELTKGEIDTMLDGENPYESSLEEEEEML